MVAKQAMKENRQCTSKYGHLRIPQDICHVRMTDIEGFLTIYGHSTEAEKGQSKNILQVQKNISNRNIFSKITAEEFVKSKKLLQILRKLLDPQIALLTIRKYFANP